MDLLFLGFVVEKENMSQYSGCSIAGNKMEYDLINALNKTNGVNIKVISALPIANFPREKRLLIKECEQTTACGFHILQVHFLNLPVIKQYLQYQAMYKAARRVLRENPKTVVLAFNLFPQVGCAVTRLQRRMNARVFSLLADLPIDDQYSRRGISKILRNQFNQLAVKNIKEVNQLIVLNKKAIELYNPNARFIVMDGACNLEDISNNVYHPKEKNIIYAGALSDYSGIIELVDAMKYVDDKEVKLQIYGDGPVREKIVRITESNPQIQYFGRVTNQEMIEIQKQAWLLVNPRPIDDPIAQVTFPSKIIEYMSTGVPVLTTRLNGFTKEYEDCLFFVESNNPEQIGEAINQYDKETLEMKKEVAENARRLLYNKKNWSAQSQRILEFME